MLLSMRHSLVTEPFGSIGRILPLLFNTMNKRKGLPVPLNVIKGEVKMLSIARFKTAMVVVCMSESGVIVGSVGSPIKKLTGMLSVMGRSPSLMILKRTLIARSPHIGGTTSTAGV